LLIPRRETNRFISHQDEAGRLAKDGSKPGVPGDSPDLGAIEALAKVPAGDPTPGAVTKKTDRTRRDASLWP
jgi:hypothetical protein